jgi:hypothetical protein
VSIGLWCFSAHFWPVVRTNRRHRAGAPGFWMGLLHGFVILFSLIGGIFSTSGLCVPE